MAVGTTQLSQKFNERYQIKWNAHPVEAQKYTFLAQRLLSKKQSMLFSQFTITGAIPVTGDECDFGNESLIWRLLLCLDSFLDIWSLNWQVQSSDWCFIWLFPEPISDSIAAATHRNTEDGQNRSLNEKRPKCVSWGIAPRGGLSTCIPTPSG